MGSESVYLPRVGTSIYSVCLLPSWGPRRAGWDKVKTGSPARGLGLRGPRSLYIIVVFSLILLWLASRSQLSARTLSTLPTPFPYSTSTRVLPRLPETRENQTAPL